MFRSKLYMLVYNDKTEENIQKIKHLKTNVQGSLLSVYQ